MKCFVHHDRDAIGICKSCGRGLCADCCSIVSRGLACKDACEDDVRRLNGLIEQNIKSAPAWARMTRSNRSSAFVVASLFLMMGAGMLYSGYASYRDYGEFGGSALIGLVMIIYSGVAFVRAARIPNVMSYAPGHCQRCGYDLTGNESGICPECGQSE